MFLNRYIWFRCRHKILINNISGLLWFSISQLNERLNSFDLDARYIGLYGAIKFKIDRLGFLKLSLSEIRISISDLVVSAKNKEYKSIVVVLKSTSPILFIEITHLGENICILSLFPILVVLVNHSMSLFRIILIVPQIPVCLKHILFDHCFVRVRQQERTAICNLSVPHFRGQIDRILGGYLTNVVNNLIEIDVIREHIFDFGDLLILYFGILVVKLASLYDIQDWLQPCIILPDTIIVPYLYYNS